MDRYEDETGRSLLKQVWKYISFETAYKKWKYFAASDCKVGYKIVTEARKGLPTESEFIFEVRFKEFLFGDLGEGFVDLMEV